MNIDFYVRQYIIGRILKVWVEASFIAKIFRK